MGNMTKIRNIKNLVSGEIDIALRRRAFEILRELSIYNQGKVLDAGCGWGYYLDLIVRFKKIFKKNRLRLVGLDNDRESIEIAKTRLKGEKVKIVYGDITDLPFPSNNFDVVILSEVLEHIDDDLKALEEIRRVLKNGGKLILTVPNKSYPFLWDPLNWILEHFFSKHIKNGFWSGIWANHLRLYGREDITLIIKKAGFKIEQVECITNWCLPFNVNLLYGGKFPTSWSNSFLKKLRKKRKSFWLKLVFFVINAVDSMNDLSLFLSRNGGVSIFVSAIK
jgi:ubiquinone/menaquinone biosynthesis C-methylase UbiE